MYPTDRNWRKVVVAAAVVLAVVAILAILLGRGCTPEPGTPEPGTPEPGTPEPGTPEPGTPEPGTPEPGTPEPGTGCREGIWMHEAVSDTADVASLISILDRDFDLRDGGEWSEPGYAVPSSSVFWTDLFENVGSLPTGVHGVRRQGGWGVYFAEVEYTIPAPNGGGRWMRLCTSLAEMPEVAVCQIPDLDDVSITATIEQMDSWFEEVGYQWGSVFASGDTLPEGAVFWTNMGEGFERPEHISVVLAEGDWGVFTTSMPFLVASGGRYVICAEPAR